MEKVVKTAAIIMLACVIGLCGVVSAAGADRDKIGVVNLQLCLNNSAKGKEFKGEFARQAEEMKAQLEAQEAELRQLKKDMEAQGMVLSETAREEKQRDFDARVKAFKDEFQAKQQELQNRDKELTGMVLKDLQKVIRDYGEKNGFTLIVERNETGTIFSAEGVDLTDTIIELYDAKTGGE